MTMTITFNNTTSTIRQNKDGLFNLTDIERAYAASEGSVGGYLRDWKRTPDVQELVKLSEISIVSMEGRNGGSYGCEEAVIEYASYCSNEFRRSVRKAFVALAKGDTEAAQELTMASLSITAREVLRSESPRVNESIRDAHTSGRLGGQEWQAAANVRGLVTEIVTGMNAKSFNKKDRYGMSAREFLLMHNDAARLVEMNSVESEIRIFLKVGYTYADLKAHYADQIEAAKANWNY